MEQAIRLLEESDLPIEVLAEQSGFANIEQFRRTFFRHLRITPLAYRERFCAR
ncbi:helix-turn-helix domain-containing protein [Geotalea uraniireducens]|uniref:helix-turn-helix domain-containing protein n=1 Tax=Geotalea uraniireducens TaxID=351604 RepID=UPI002490AB55|nr:helix-turn-helix domain-containing protein [Geotalea uraniireducens]